MHFRFVISCKNLYGELKHKGGLCVHVCVYVCSMACCSRFCCRESSLLTSAGCSFTDCHNSLSDFIKIRPHTCTHTLTHTQTRREIGKRGEAYWPRALSTTNKTLLTCLFTSTHTFEHTHIVDLGRCVWTII